MDKKPWQRPKDQGKRLEEGKKLPAEAKKTLEKGRQALANIR